MNPGAPAGASVARVQPMATNPPPVPLRGEGCRAKPAHVDLHRLGRAVRRLERGDEEPRARELANDGQAQPRPVRVAVERGGVGARGLDRDRPRRENAKPGRGEVAPRGVTDERGPPRRADPAAGVCEGRDGVLFGPGRCAGPRAAPPRLLCVRHRGDVEQHELAGALQAHPEPARRERLAREPVRGVVGELGAKRARLQELRGHAHRGRSLEAHLALDPDAERHRDGRSYPLDRLRPKPGDAASRHTAKRPPLHRDASPARSITRGVPARTVEREPPGVELAVHVVAHHAHRVGDGAGLHALAEHRLLDHQIERDHPAPRPFVEHPFGGVASPRELPHRALASGEFRVSGVARGEVVEAVLAARGRQGSAPARRASRGTRPRRRSASGRAAARCRARTCRRAADRGRPGAPSPRRSRSGGMWIRSALGAVIQPTPRISAQASATATAPHSARIASRCPASSLR